MNTVAATHHDVTLDFPVALEDCTDELDFLWMQRACACDSPNNDLQSLQELDEAISAQIELIRLHARGARARRSSTLDPESAGFCLDCIDCVIPSDPRPSPWPLARLLAWLPNADRRGLLDRHSPLDEQMLVRFQFETELRQVTEDDCRRLLDAKSRTVRELACLAAGQCGLRSMLLPCVDCLDTPVAWRALCAAEAATLLGDRDKAFHGLCAVADSGEGDARWRALKLLMMASGVNEGLIALQALAPRQDSLRLQVMGLGHVGDAKYAPWLIDQMTNPAVARVAAEAFVHITGADFNLDQLEAMPPDDFEDRPSDDQKRSTLDKLM